MPNALEVTKAAIDDFKKNSKVYGIGKGRERCKNICGIEGGIPVFKNIVKCGRRESDGY